MENTAQKDEEQRVYHKCECGRVWIEVPGIVPHDDNKEFEEWFYKEYPEPQCFDLAVVHYQNHALWTERYTMAKRSWLMSRQTLRGK